MGTVGGEVDIRRRHRQEMLEIKHPVTEMKLLLTGFLVDWTRLRGDSGACGCSNRILKAQREQDGKKRRVAKNRRTTASVKHALMRLPEGEERKEQEKMFETMTGFPPN